MKHKILFLLFICNSLYSQSSSSFQISGNQIDFFQHNKDLKDENGISILDSKVVDSLVFSGMVSGDHFGVSVSTAGDVNGDGLSDIIVGVEYFNSGTGRAYVYFGGTNIDNIADVTFTGEASGNLFGISVSSAGDVNGDGYSDVIVGANIRRRAYIYYGGQSMNNVADVIMSGEVYFGRSVSEAGDVNADGYSDVIVGAYGYSSDKGRTYIFFGGLTMNNIADVIMTGEAVDNSFGASVSIAGDVNNDQISDVIVGAPGYSSGIGRAYIYFGGIIMDSIADVIMTGIGHQFGCSVSSSGDVNGDGYSDVIVGALIGNAAYIMFGGINMDNIADIILIDNVTDSFGNSVSRAGDINRDGFSDVIVGAPKFNNGSGRAYIYFGGTNMDNVADIIKTGETLSDQFGYSVSEAGDVNGDGFSDVIVGELDEFGIGRVFLYMNLIPKPYLIFPSNGSLNNSLNINFKWNKLNTAIYYSLFVSTDSDFINVIAKDSILFDTSKTINGFQKGIKYFWRVKAKDTSGFTFNSSIWDFTTTPPIYLVVKLLFEGMYSPVFNQLSRKDSITLYLRDVNSPFALIDSARNTIDTISFSNLFKFNNATSGYYYIVTKQFNCIETWSKSGGELLSPDGTIYSYDFTTSSSQAYGDNLKLKGSKYCLYSGDINQDRFITLFDVIPIYNDASSFVSGNYIPTDLTGEGIVDLTDVTLCYNNSSNFISIRKP